MKTAKLVIGIVSMVLSVFVLLQSCAAGAANALSANGQVSGTAGLMVAAALIIAGIVGVATRKATGRGGALTAAGFYLAAALIGVASAGNYTDLYIWSFVAWAFGAVYLVDAFYDRYRTGDPVSWWQQAGVIALVLIIFPPAGIVLLWLSHQFETAPKIITTVICGLAFLVMVSSFNSVAGSGNASAAGSPAAATTSGTASTTAAKTDQSAKVYGPGETWTVDGQFSLTFTAAAATDERNQFSDKNPAQVVILNYDYENIGVEKNVQDLHISTSQFKVIDAGGEMASSYPANISGYPQPTPIGAKCIGSQCAYGLNNQSPAVTVNVEVYGNNYKSYEATFKLPVT
jgi:hypothetical protein